jgi:hypothetical protein
VQYEDAVLLFAKLPHVPFTNNRAKPRRSHFLTHLCSLEADPPRAQ